MSLQLPKYCLIICCLFANFLLGQDFNKNFIDKSLESAYEKSQKNGDFQANFEKLKTFIRNHPDTVQDEIYHYLFQNDSSGLAIQAFYEDYIKRLEKKGNINIAVDLYVDVAWQYINQGDDKALEIADKALRLSKDKLFYTGIVKAKEIQGLFYEIVKGDAEQASVIYFEALEICKKHQLAYTSEIFHTIGVLFHTSDNYKKAKTYYSEALKEAERQNNEELQKRCLINLGSVYSSLEEFDVAEKYLIQSLDIPKKTQYDYDAYANLGNLYIRQKSYQKALPFLEKATEIHPDNYDADLNLRFLIDVKANLKDTTEMHSIMNRAETALSNINSLRDKSLLLRSVSNYYKTNEDYEKALHYKGEYLRVYERVIENQKNETLLDLEAKYQSEKIKASLSKKEKQQTLLFIGVIVLLLFLIGLYAFYKNQLKYKNVLQQKKIKELTQNNKLLALSSMIEGQENERMRIARDLHDSLGGLLSSVKAHFTIFKNQFDKNQEFEMTQKTYQLIDESCIEVRRISHNMMPHSLSLSGLKGSLEDIAQHMESLGYNVTLDIHHLHENMDTTKQITIFRLVQETLSNIRKHANARNVLIQLIGAEDELQLIVEDDGKGFDYQEALKNKSLGLNNINSRVEFLDGTIQWESIINEGTTITINIPHHSNGNKSIHS